MYANVAVHGAMVKANSASARIGKELQVETVDATMDEAIEHKTAHDEVSMALAGGSLLDVVDPDELASDMESFMAQQQQQRHGVSSSSAAVMPPPMTKNEQSAYHARQLEADEEVSRILDSMPAPRTQAPLTLAQRSVLAQNQRARKGGSTVTNKK